MEWISHVQFPLSRVDAARRAEVADVLLVGIGTFCIHLLVALMLFAEGAIQLNLLFESDSSWYFQGFAFGTGAYGSYGGRGIVHPNIANLIHPIIALLTAAGALVLGDASREVIRYCLAAGVAPAAAALRNVFLFLALTTTGYSRRDALLGVALTTAGFSGVLFGSIPESFGLTAAVLAYVFYLVAQDRPFGRVERPWLLAGMLLFSITTTNIVPFGLLLTYLIYSHKHRIRVALEGAASTCFGAAVISGGLFVVLTSAHGASSYLTRDVGQLEDIDPSVRSAVFRVPNSLVNSIVAEKPSVVFAGPASEGNTAQRTQAIRFTFRRDLGDILAADRRATYAETARPNPVLRLLSFGLIGGLVALGMFAYSAIGVGKRLLASAAIIQLSYNWVFHSLFGKELFLYSQHWYVPLVVLLLTGVAEGARRRTLARILLSVLLVMSVVQSIRVISFIRHSLGQ